MPSKKTTLDELARMTARGFEGAASKADVKDILLAIQGNDLHLSAYASRWSEDFERLEKRVSKLEAKAVIR